MKNVTVKNVELCTLLTENNMSTQIALTGIVPKIEEISLSSMKIKNSIRDLESELANIQRVNEIQYEILSFKKDLLSLERMEAELREQGKEIMMNSNLKEFKTLDWVTLSLQFSPWAIVIEDESKIPSEFFNEKTTRTVDKMALKKAVTEWTLQCPEIYIQKEVKFVIKH